MIRLPLILHLTSEKNMAMEITPLPADARTKFYLRKLPQKVSRATAEYVDSRSKTAISWRNYKLQTSVGLNTPFKCGQQF
jgi:hypothetical protein